MTGDDWEFEDWPEPTVPPGSGDAGSGGMSGDLLNEAVRPPEAKVILSRSQNAGDEVLGILAWDIITSDVPRLAQTVIDVTTERDDLRARLGAVEALHTEMTVTTGVSFIVGEPPRTLSTKQTCAYCSTRFVGGSEAVGWPCPTIAAVNSAAARASAVPPDPTDDEARETFADELEAPGSPLCNCEADDNPPVSPATRERMAHHCECRAVVASEILRRGVTRSLHARACSPNRRHPGEPS